MNLTICQFLHVTRTIMSINSFDLRNYLYSGCRQLVDIENEYPSELRSQRCSRRSAVKMGKLDTSNERYEGVYWIDVDENSETCPFVSDE